MRGVSVGSRQTRKKRRSRRRRAEVRESASAHLRDSARDPLLLVALVGAVAATVVATLVGKATLAILFCLVALLLCAALWARRA